jgi:hypothetical protein
MYIMLFPRSTRAIIIFFKAALLFVAISCDISGLKKIGTFLAGQITGGYEELSPPEYIRCKWRMADWPESVFSTVR